MDFEAPNLWKNRSGYWKRRERAWEREQWNWAAAAGGDRKKSEGEREMNVRTYVSAYVRIYKLLWSPVWTAIERTHSGSQLGGCLKCPQRCPDDRVHGGGGCGGASGVGNLSRDKRMGQTWMLSSMQSCSTCPARNDLRSTDLWIGGDSCESMLAA